MLILNLGIAVFGFVGSLAAFGGETWEEGDEAVLKRVTRRGWVALACLSAAFLLGGVKEVAQHRISLEEAAVKTELQEKNELQRQEIGRQLGKIEDLQTRIESSTAELEASAEKLSEEQLASIEVAFKLAIKIPRETDDAFVSLRGQGTVPVPSRYHHQMQLYWGDQVHFVLMPYDEHSPSELRSLKLRVGEKEYPLHDGSGSGFFERDLRIYGSSPEPMLASILNPRRLDRIDFKFFVRTTDSSQGQEEFRRLILTSPFRELAKTTYKATTGSILNMRAGPDSDSQVRSRLLQGSFVRVLQSQGAWSEILTPEGRQGWVSSEYLGSIE